MTRVLLGSDIDRHRYLASGIDACQYVSMPIAAPCCFPVLQGSLSRSDAEALASGFKALADAVRLRLLSFIASQPEGEACVCQVTGPAGLSQPTVSHHLKVLHDAGLLEREKRGAWVYYRVKAEQIESLRAALTTRPRRART